ncbi:MAG: asparagine synthase (glutamine-hydrolyzing) [Acidimicrobiales bacterium]|nr:asparagine synthase (glutamine-hydrolyzing) [Acidimicrobiales bacterium]
MCGITGLIKLDGSNVDPVSLQRMTNSLTHRGPDGEGQWIKGNVAFGHRRLAILDLSEAAEQPMCSFDDNYVLVYNGEVYNFVELRKELELLGYRFKSNGDAEVVLNSLIEWGPSAVKRFNGMFAFAFWNEMEKELLLGRDRYGIKPLYISNTNSALIFGSEQRSIRSSGMIQKNLNMGAVYEYFTFQNILSNETFVEGVEIFPAGHIASLDLKKVSPSLRYEKYWDFNFHDSEEEVAYSEYTEELNRLFIAAVEKQLVSDVEVGSFLSGGIDSGSIVSVASRKLPGLKTFTCGFDLSSVSGIELAFDERKKARKLSEEFGTSHFEKVLRSGDMEKVMPNLVKHLEELRVGQSFPNYYAASLAREQVKVVLGGTGGDELFGGYPWRYYNFPGQKSFDSFANSYFAHWQRLAEPEEISDLFSPCMSDLGDVSMQQVFKNVLSGVDSSFSKSEDYINACFYFESKTFLHGLLMVDDKLSMAHSLESRVPFLDNDLVDFAMQCPVKLKLGSSDETFLTGENSVFGKTNGEFQKTNVGKKILRKAMEGFLPKGFADANKQGFSAPDASWFRGESFEYLSRVLSDEKAVIYDLLDYKTVQKFVDQHVKGNSNRRLLIWSLLSFEQWLQNEMV